MCLILPLVHILQDPHLLCLLLLPWAPKLKHELIGFKSIFPHLTASQRLGHILGILLDPEQQVPPEEQRTTR